MARTNYSFEKRQRELAKKKKKEEKRLRKQGGGESPEDQATSPADESGVQESGDPAAASAPAPQAGSDARPPET